FKPLAREDVVHTSTQALLLEGMRRIDEWSRFRELLPPLEAKLAIDFGALATRYKDVPDEVRPMLHLFDGRRSIIEVVNEAAMDDIGVLSTISELHRSAVLRPSDKAGAAPSALALASVSSPASTSASASASSSPDIESWLSGTPKMSQISELPSALGRA